MGKKFVMLNFKTRKRFKKSFTPAKAIFLFFLFFLFILSTSTGLVISRAIFKSSSVSSLPSLYVDGPYIKRSDNQEPIQLKGVASTLFYHNRKTPFSHTIETLESELGNWNINLIKVSFDAVDILNPQQYQDLDKLIDYTQKRGIYTILDPALVNYEALPFPDERVETAAAFLTKRYSHKSHILYGLWSQAADVLWEDWIVRAIKIATSIRQENPDALLVVAGTKWGRDFSYLKESPFPFNQVIYDVHDYAWGDQSLDIRPWWTFLIGRYPVLISAFGGAHVANQEVCPFRSQCDLSYIEETLTIVNDRPKLIHYTFEPFDKLVDGNGLNEWGKIIYEDINREIPFLE